MKKIILIAAIAASSFSSNAQVTFGGQVGLNLGMGHASYDYVDPIYSGVALANDPKVGFLIGVLADVAFGEQISFRPELNFVQKGSKNGYGSSSSKRTLNYLELPLNAVYKMSLGGSNNKLYFGLGPAIGLGLSGKYKNGTSTKVKFDGKKSDDFTGDDSKYYHLKRVDIGLNILAGYQLGMGAFAKIGYTLGFPNIDPDKGNSDPTDRGTYKNRGVSICIGYMLGGSSKKK